MYIFAQNTKESDYLNKDHRTVCISRKILGRGEGELQPPEINTVVPLSLFWGLSSCQPYNSDKHSKCHIFACNTARNVILVSNYRFLWSKNPIILWKIVLVQNVHPRWTFVSFQVHIYTENVWNTQTVTLPLHTYNIHSHIIL